MKNKDLKEKDTLYGDVEFNIDRIKNKKWNYVLFYRFTKLLTFLSGVLITILVGWKGGSQNNPDFNNYLLLIGAFITLLTALFDLKDKAMGYDLFYLTLEDLGIE